MVNRNTLNNITISVVSGVLSGYVVALSFGGKPKLPSWGVALMGIIIILLIVIGVRIIELFDSGKRIRKYNEKQEAKKVDWSKVTAISNIALASATFIAVLAAIGYFNSADIHQIRQIPSYNECPNHVQNVFILQFVNYGNKGTSLCVKVQSNKLNFSKDFDCLFIFQSPTTYEFVFEERIEPEFREQTQNVSIFYSINYKKNNFQTVDKTYECKYVLRSYASSLILR